MSIPSRSSVDCCRRSTVRRSVSRPDRVRRGVGVGTAAAGAGRTAARPSNPGWRGRPRVEERQDVGVEVDAQRECGEGADGVGALITSRRFGNGLDRRLRPPASGAGRRGRPRPACPRASTRGGCWARSEREAVGGEGAALPSNGALPFSQALRLGDEYRSRGRVAVHRLLNARALPHCGEVDECRCEVVRPTTPWLTKSWRFEGLGSAGHIDHGADAVGVLPDDEHVAHERVRAAIRYLELHPLVDLGLEGRAPSRRVRPPTDSGGSRHVPHAGEHHRANLGPSHRPSASPRSPPGPEPGPLTCSGSRPVSVSRFSTIWSTFSSSSEASSCRTRAGEPMSPVRFILLARGRLKVDVRVDRRLAGASAAARSVATEKRRR